MRELHLVPDESTPTQLVVTTAGPDTEPTAGEQFRIEVTDALRTLLGATPAPSAESTAKDTEASDAEDKPDTPAPARPVRQVDPGLSAPLTMRPREIQERIRGGASIAQLAEEMGVAQSRVEPFAHPVLLERSRMAGLAKQAHPVRDDGPASLTLWEILATAFAARGAHLAAATWDSYRDDSGQWVAVVAWDAGLSHNTAEWAIDLHATSAATATPRDPMAADLINPEFLQPVRSLTAVSRGYMNNSPAESETEKTLDDLPAVGGEDAAEEDEFLRHPEAREQEPPAQRRRKAVTPHWEDVLLGVRTNTKRPRK